MKDRSRSFLMYIGKSWAFWSQPESRELVLVGSETLAEGQPLPPARSCVHVYYTEWSHTVKTTYVQLACTLYLFSNCGSLLWWALPSCLLMRRPDFLKMPFLFSPPDVVKACLLAVPPRDPAVQNIQQRSIWACEWVRACVRACVCLSSWLCVCVLPQMLCDLRSVPRSSCRFQSGDDQNVLISSLWWNDLL